MNEISGLFVYGPAEGKDKAMELKFQDGMLPAIIQETASGKVLMLGYMNREAYDETLRSGYVTFFSRRRRKLWTKGETSGHRLRVREIRIDCDADTLLIDAELTGGGCCHEGFHSCFYRRITPQGEEPVEERLFDPGEVYKAADRAAPQTNET